MPHILVLAALLGAVNGFDIPARQSFVVEMVGRDDLANAIALNSSVFNGARVVGPAVAGRAGRARSARAGASSPTASRYLAVIAEPRCDAPAAASRPQAGPIGPCASLAEGLRYVAPAPGRCAPCCCCSDW